MMSANDVIIHDSSEDTQPEKYGRTLARDAEMLKQGGVPDFAPLARPKDGRAAGSPPIQPPPGAPPPPRPHTLMPPLVAPIETYVGGSTQESIPAVPPAAKERLVASSPIAPPAPPLPQKPLAIQPLTPRPSVPPPPIVAPIETYAGDFADMLKKTGASAMTVLAAEQDKEKRSPVPQVPQERSRGNLLYVVAGTILLVAGAAGAYVAYLRYYSELAPFAPAMGTASIFIDEREQISGSDSALLKAAIASLARAPAPGAVRLLYGVTATTSVTASLLAKAPDIVRRNMNAGNSMVGIVNVGGSASPFFILSVSSYGNTFSGMLWWEKTMPNDLSALFGGTRLSLTTASSTATATTSMQASGKATRGTATTTVARQAGFRDEIIGNHDARVYRDEDGKSIILYGYWDKTTLVIARDPGAFIEILQRLATSRAR